MTTLQVEANKLRHEKDKLDESRRHNLETEQQGRTKLVTDVVGNVLSSATRPFKFTGKLL